jgi:hypothetical protein
MIEGIKHSTFNIQLRTLNGGARRAVTSALDVECWALNVPVFFR